MGVNIWVTQHETGEKFLVCWGDRMVAYTDPEDRVQAISAVGAQEGVFGVRETPAEIMALVAAEERKQQRREIAAQFLSGAAVHMSERPDDFPDSTPRDYARWSVDAADALLAALDAREGAE